MTEGARAGDAWVRYLRVQAAEAWGAARAAELEPALRRMAAALDRVAERTPHVESAPYLPPRQVPQSAADD